MDADEARHGQLIEAALAAHRRCIGINLARATRSLYSAHKPTPEEMAESAAAEAAAVAADKALADWISPEARLTRGH